MRSAPVLIISTGVEETCAHKATHVQQHWDITSLLPQALGLILIPSQPLGIPLFL